MLIKFYAHKDPLEPYPTKISATDVLLILYFDSSSIYNMVHIRRGSA